MKIHLKVAAIIILFSLPLTAQQKTLSLADIMKFKQIKEYAVSDNGNWIAYTANPDRGNGELIVKNTANEVELKFAVGSKPVFSKNDLWLSGIIVPDFLEAEEKKDDKPVNDLLLLNLSNNDSLIFKNVKSSAFSANSKWIVYQHGEEKLSDSLNSDSKKKKAEKPNGTTLVLRNLNSKDEMIIPNAIDFAFDSLSNYLSVTVGDTTGKSNGIFLYRLNETSVEKIIVDTLYNGIYTSISWSRSGKLAFIRSVFSKDKKQREADLFIWDGDLKLAAASSKAPEGWFIPEKNKLEWSRDEERLFFGYKPKNSEEVKDTTKKDPYDIDNIISRKELIVWHWNDPIIKTHAKTKWEVVKDQTYTAVYFLDNKKIIQLADLDMPYVKVTDNNKYMLGYSDVPYLKYITWEGSFYDFYIVDLPTGKRKKFVERIENTAQLSPDAQYAVYYRFKNYYLYNFENNSTKNLTEDFDVSFSNEDFDEPADPPGYGFGGWINNGEAFYLYDKYDVWKFESASGEGENITKSFGRNNNLQFRIKNFDADIKYFSSDEDLFLTAFHDQKKYTALYKLNGKDYSLTKLVDGNFKYVYKAKAKNADKFLFTRENYTEYPDLWLADKNFLNTRRLSNLTNQTKGFAWGTSELIEWTSLDGIPLQGVLIKPGNYDPTKKYPVIVYFYEISSYRLFEFNDMVVNHRPNFPFYASNGYAVFLPDVKFEVGRPGLSATKCVVPGVQKLVELGIADEKRIGLHGHSWGGYETAIMVTQTNYFACAVAGAPVANMISAYSGIRLESGMARQFQYEKYQSRIGGSLWEYPERFIENSPVFFADKINTPLLIEHGDIDEAVPWFQSIELYLAMRRLGKEAIFLQYEGEPHHLKKYPNKVDYTIKMKQFFDHYLKDEPAPDWLLKGEIYSR